MNVRYVCKWCLVAALAALGTNLGLHKAICPHRRPRRLPRRGTSAHPRAGTRGLRGNGDFRSPAGHRGAESAAGRHRRTAAGTATGRGPTSRGSPATGPGTTNEATSFGSAASGAICRPAANGCPVIGASPGKAINGLPGTGPMPR